MSELQEPSNVNNVKTKTNFWWIALSVVLLFTTIGGFGAAAMFQAKANEQSNIASQAKKNSSTLPFPCGLALQMGTKTIDELDIIIAKILNEVVNPSSSAAPIYEIKEDLEATHENKRNYERLAGECVKSR